MNGKSKTAAMMTWLRYSDEFIKLNSIMTRINEKSMTPVYNDRVNFEYIDGTQDKTYTFIITSIQRYSTGNDDINQDALEAMEAWTEWIETTWKEGNRPNWGDNVNFVELDPAYSVPELAMIYEDSHLAQYQMMIRINYREKE